MKRELILTPRFKRAFRRFVGRDARLHEWIEDTLELMRQDVFAASLGTHKLSGTLAGLRACSCGYDCRIVFAIDRNPDTGGEMIVLLDIGTHDEIY